MGQRTVYTAGEYGNTVAVVERPVGGNYHLRVPHPEYSSGYRMESLEHRNLSRAKSRADRVAAEIREGRQMERGEPTLAHIFDLYESHEVPDKGHRQTERDTRGIAFWTAVVGGSRRPSQISSARWSEVMRARKHGRIDARGRPVSGKRSEVKWSTVWRDLFWLQKVLNWATRWRTSEGVYLLSENPVRGYRMPDRETPSRPVATRERYEATAEKAKVQQMAVTWGGSKRRIRSHLWELLDVVVGTGRRVSAVCGLTHGDVHLATSEAAPYGAVTWPGETDKQGERWRAPLTPKARGALVRARERFPGVGEAKVFPAATDRSRGTPRTTAHKWLKAAERAAELAPIEGGAWHPYRRMWATERMHLPRKAVARAGGWKDPSVMETCYQEADDRAVRDVVLDVRPRRESGG